MKKPGTTKAPAEQVVKDIRRATRKLHSSEEKIRIVLSGLRGEDSIAELCRKEGLCCTTPVRDSPSSTKFPRNEADLHGVILSDQ